MGLSSSQARLLSITARLTDNEYRTQRLTNARLKLTDISDAARVQYQNALDSDKFVYMAFDSTGANVKTDLTPAVLYQYQPSKNQYALVNNANKILVSSVDAKNFEETDTLAEFLKRYDCLQSNQITKVYNEEVKELNGAYIEWINSPEGIATTFKDNSLSKIFMEGANSCYQNATTGTSSVSGCYLHVLAHMLCLVENEDYYSGFDTLTANFYNGSYTTSIGTDLNDRTYKRVPSSEISGSAINTSSHSNNLIPISVALREGYIPEGSDDKYTISAAPINDYQVEGLILSEEVKKLIGKDYIAGDNPTDEQILLSNYYMDSDGKIKLKTLRQKAIDLFALVADTYSFYRDHQYYLHKFFVEDDDNIKLNNTYNNIFKPLIQTFQIDMKLFTAVVEDDSEDPPQMYITKTINHEEKIEELKIKDPEKAQWYTNLWYRMNGMDEPERIYKDVVDVVNDRQEDTTRTDYLLELVNLQKQTYFVNYDVLDSNLVSSKDWLNNALSQGLVTMQKVGASRTVNNDKFKWSSIIYTNATDIISQKDDTKIAQAEARYTQVLSEVNAKDKVFENKIRKLDTEHNALQTEYNSVKAAMDKNIERSFKAFQG